MTLNPPDGEFPRISDVGNRASPKVGDYVKLLPRADKDIVEGVVCSRLFDTIFEVGYADSQGQPITHWFDVNEIFALEIVS